MFSSRNCAAAAQCAPARDPHSPHETYRAGEGAHDNFTVVRTSSAAENTNTASVICVMQTLAPGPSA
jgi:hypothetical protein